MTAAKDRARFASKTVRDSSGCLLWTGSVNKDGYGLFWLNRKYETAHRVAWRWANGSIPEESCVLHRCDTPPCVLPEHLFLGTQQDNVADKVAKTRQARGETSGLAKLTWSEVSLIRRLANQHSRMALARRFNVSKRAIQFIVQGKTWR